ncbi:hypothetical protein TREMEDRAFT_65612 [Tremella mesenterica DSM 1558]|uniref:uncharacterized protein n=1 Tax=Tremella mesenterica (strain ATCC 24925 / CBS 8224 / DSM 1558 / NBRC 9311 / NRRL Y-6157 / RJB 2259-6 / UBC 559-6) TaxID=578456 RepID=UPI00032C8E2E|nr:uncharacterized protein TREMEDRAFT_65612 [Tremella mesenterica DSM 1558]EIW66337.1 hypothetical protein TREMEDRAFT_65612 [Tremella mesenterica DSM 1558]
MSPFDLLSEGLAQIQSTVRSTLYNTFGNERYEETGYEDDERPIPAPDIGLLSVHWTKKYSSDSPPPSPNDSEGTPAPTVAQLDLKFPSGSSNYRIQYHRYGGKQVTYKITATLTTKLSALDPAQRQIEPMSDASKKESCPDDSGMMTPEFDRSSPPQSSDEVLQDKGSVVDANDDTRLNERSEGEDKERSDGEDAKDDYPDWTKSNSVWPDQDVNRTRFSVEVSMTLNDSDDSSDRNGGRFEGWQYEDGDVRYISGSFKTGEYDEE